MNNHLDPLLIKFTSDERNLTRDVRVAHGVPEAKFIKAAIRVVFKNPRLFAIALKEATK